MIRVNTTDTGTAYLSGAPKITPGSNGDRNCLPFRST